MKLLSTVILPLIALLPLAVSAGSEETYRGDGHMMITPDALEWGPVASMGKGKENSGHTLFDLLGSPRASFRSLLVILPPAFSA